MWILGGGGTGAGAGEFSLRVEQATTLYYTAPVLYHTILLYGEPSVKNQNSNFGSDHNCLSLVFLRLLADKTALAALKEIYLKRARDPVHVSCRQIHTYDIPYLQN